MDQLGSYILNQLHMGPVMVLGNLIFVFKSWVGFKLFSSTMPFPIDKIIESYNLLEIIIYLLQSFSIFHQLYYAPLNLI